MNQSYMFKNKSILKDINVNTRKIKGNDPIS